MEVSCQVSPSLEWGYPAKCHLLLNEGILPSVTFSWIWVSCQVSPSLEWGYPDKFHILLNEGILPSVPFSWMRISCQVSHSLEWGYRAKGHPKLLMRLVVCSVVGFCSDQNLMTLGHRRRVTTLCILYKVCSNTKHCSWVAAIGLSKGKAYFSCCSCSSLRVDSSKMFYISIYNNLLCRYVWIWNVEWV